MNNELCHECQKEPRREGHYNCEKCAGVKPAVGRGRLLTVHEMQAELMKMAQKAHAKENTVESIFGLDNSGNVM